MAEQNGIVKTNSPHSEDWKVGTCQSSPLTSEHVSLDPKELGNCYGLVISLVVPRPIALVSTRSKHNGDNVAPFSYFGLMGHAPPCVAIGFCNKGDGKKDSLINIEESPNKEFCVNIIGEWMVESANFTCGNFDVDKDEFMVGLTKVQCDKIDCPRVKQSAASMECVARHIIPMGASTIVIGEVIQFHVQQELIDTSGATPVIDIEKYNPVSRLGGNLYGTLGRYFEIARPTAEDWKQVETFHQDTKEK